MSPAEFARLIDDEGTREEIRQWFTGKLLPDQLGENGSFPKELERTKPYSYSIFNFDVMAGLAQSLKGSGKTSLPSRYPMAAVYAKLPNFFTPIWKIRVSGRMRRMWSTSMLQFGLRDCFSLGRLATAPSISLFGRR